MKYINYILIFILLSLSSSCKKDEDATGTIKIVFEHFVDGEVLEYDQLQYFNAAGNEYMVNEIQYFISNVVITTGKTEVQCNQNGFAHYIDTDIKASQKWIINDLKCGDYSSFAFTFGFNEDDNKTGIFPNAPESNMFWPALLGGGYHYMKLNGKWKSDDSGEISPYNFHLGIGQRYKNNVVNPDSIVAFVHNDFDVLLMKNFEIKENDTTTIRLRMNVEEWFKNPNVWDINVYGGKIMQNQEAMNAACENGRSVFTLN